MFTEWSLSVTGKFGGREHTTDVTLCFRGKINEWTCVNGRRIYDRHLTTEQWADMILSLIEWPECFDVSGDGMTLYGDFAVGEPMILHIEPSWCDNLRWDIEIKCTPELIDRFRAQRNRKTLA